MQELVTFVAGALIGAGALFGILWHKGLIGRRSPR